MSFVALKSKIIVHACVIFEILIWSKHSKHMQRDIYLLQNAAFSVFWEQSLFEHIFPSSRGAQTKNYRVKNGKRCRHNLMSHRSADLHLSSYGFPSFALSLLWLIAVRIQIWTDGGYDQNSSQVRKDMDVRLLCVVETVHIFCHQRMLLNQQCYLTPHITWSHRSYSFSCSSLLFLNVETHMGS